MYVGPSDTIRRLSHLGILRCPLLRIPDSFLCFLLFFVKPIKSIKRFYILHFSAIEFLPDSFLESFYLSAEIYYIDIIMSMFSFILSSMVKIAALK